MNESVKSTLCLIGGCHGAGKTTLARELLPRMGIRRFLNADEIARGLSPLDPTLSAFRAGRLLIEEARSLVEARTSFALESTLSGKTHLSLLRTAKKRGFEVTLHFIRLTSPDLAVERVALRKSQGGHDVPEADIHRRFFRGRRHFLECYLPLADHWVVWENTDPPLFQKADSQTHSTEDLSAMISPSRVQETPPEKIPEFVRIGLEASRVATEKMLDYYRRMDIEVTPQMTLVKRPSEVPKAEPPSDGAGTGL